MMSRTRIKFCGMMRPEDARAAAEAGADAVGMILHADARRKIDLPTAQLIAQALPPYVATVGVFVDAEPSRVIDCINVALLHTAQLHGDETPEDVARCGAVPVIKAIKADARLADTLAAWRDAAAEVPNLTGLLIDGPGGGGTGEPQDFGRIRRLIDDGALEGLPPLIVAGGLRPETVAAVVGQLRPYAVDASSGVEAAYGEKSADKMRAFADAVAAACLVPSPGTPGEGTRGRAPASALTAPPSP